MILPHTLLYGGAGAGKTTLAKVIKNELSIIYKRTIGFHEYTPAEMSSTTAILVLASRLVYGDVVFIDEIHSLNPDIEEALYSMLQDFTISISGRGIEVPKFTMIGATTNAGKLEKPLRDRFAIQIELDPAATEDLVAIVNDQAVGKKEPKYLRDYHGQKNAKTIISTHLRALTIDKEFEIKDDIKELIAHRALGNPRVCKQILKHFVALQKVLGKSVNKQESKEWLEIVGIDDNGLHKPDIRIVKELIARGNKPMGSAALASVAGISKADFELVCEPRMEYCKLMYRTPKGRCLTDKGIQDYTPKTIYDILLETLGKDKCQERTQ